MITSSSLPSRNWLYKHKPIVGHQQVNPDPEPEVDEEVEELLTEETDEEEWFEWDNG